MTERVAQKITYKPEKVIQPIYTGGDVTLDSNGRILATCIGEDVILTDLRNGKTLARIDGDGETVTTLRITPSASHLIICSRSLSMRIYALEASTGSTNVSAILARALKPHNTPVVTAAIDSTSTLLATGGSDGSIKVWDILGGYSSHTFRGHTGVISALNFFELPLELAARPLLTGDAIESKNHDLNQKRLNGIGGSRSDYGTALALRLASGGEDGKIRIWDLVKRKAIASLDSHVSVVRALDFTPGRATLISVSRDKTLISWDAKTWKILRTIPVLESLECAGFIENGQFAYTGGEHGRLRIWDMSKGREMTLRQSALGESDRILQALYSHPNQFLMTVHVDQTFKFHTLEGLTDLANKEISEPLPVVRQISGTHDEVIDMAYVGLERNIMALATNSESVRLVSVSMNPSGSEDTTYFGADLAQLKGHEDIVICLDVDWSGCWLATGAKDNAARLWNLDISARSFKCHAIFTGHAESLGAIALPVQKPQSDSAGFKAPLKYPPQLLVTGSQDKTIKLWKISADIQETQKNPRALYTRKAHEKDINALAFNHDSTLFASASQDRTVKIWSVEDGETQGVLRGHKRGVWSVRFASNDTPPVSGEFGGMGSGRGLVLTGSGDKTVKIWSLTDFNCIRTFEGHTNSVLKVIWLPRVSTRQEQQKPAVQLSALVASAGSDGLVKVWDASTGECACTLDNHTDRVWSLAVNSMTGQLASGGADSVVTFWADTTASTAAVVAASNSARVEQEQELLNHIHQGNYHDAIVIALQLNHPTRLLALFAEITSKSPSEDGSLCGLKTVDEVITNLSDDHLYTFLLRIRDWNTNARTAPVAQRLLSVVTKSYPASHLVELRKKGRGLYDVVEALRAYTERHYNRCEELIEESYLVDFVVKGMGDTGFVADGNRSVTTESNGSEFNTDMIMVG